MSYLYNLYFNTFFLIDQIFEIYKLKFLSHILAWDHYIAYMYVYI